MTLDSATGARSATVSITELAGWSGLALVARLADGTIMVSARARASASPSNRSRAMARDGTEVAQAPSAWMTAADVRGLTPLVWSHVSPYGAFDLDMERRLDLEIQQAA